MSLFCFDKKVLSEFSFGLASTSDQRSQALQLRQDVYEYKGLLKKGKSEFTYFLPQTFLPDSAILIASRNGEVVGTISLYADSEIGLPIDEVHPVEAREMRYKVTRLAEVGALAVKEEFREFNITLMLFYALYRWSCERKFDGLIASVNPSVKRVYSWFLLFNILGESCLHPRLRNAISIPIGLNLNNVTQLFHKTYEEATGKLNLYSFFYETEFPLDFPESINEDIVNLSRGDRDGS